MLLALLVAAAPVSDFHVSVAAGFGAAYGYSGMHLEVSRGNFAVFGGVGLGMMVLNGATNLVSGNSGYGDDIPHLPIALGVRASMRPEGGPFAAATFCTMGYTYFDESFSASGRVGGLSGNRASATLTAGYRWAFSTLFFELALGGGIAKVVDQGFKIWDGSSTPPRNEVGFQPDAALAIGARF